MQACDETQVVVGVKKNRPRWVWCFRDGPPQLLSFQSVHLRLIRLLHGSKESGILAVPTGATRFRRKLSRPEGMPGATWP